MRPFLFVIFLLFSSITFAQKKMIVLGDSLTEGYGVAQDAAYPLVLQKKLQGAGKSWSVVNAGVSGSTTASAISRLKWLIKNKPDLVLIVLGANDGLRGINPEASEKNLAVAIEFLQKEKIKVVLGGLYMPPNYGKDYTEKFKKIYSNLAKKYQIKLIPFILDKVAGDPKMNLADGIHPNEQGHKMIAEHIFNSMKDEL